MIKEIDTYLETGFKSFVTAKAGEEQNKSYLKLKKIDCSVIDHYLMKVDGTRLDYSGCVFKDID